QDTIREESGYDGYDDTSNGVDLPAELDEMISELRSQTSKAERERDAALARIAELEAALLKLIKASSRLAIAAQTTGGVAGRDEGLCLEIDRLAQPLGEARAALAPKES